MGLNIKNEETCRTRLRANARAARTPRVAKNAGAMQNALARELHAIGLRCAGLVGPGTSAVEHGDALYDERGLPNSVGNPSLLGRD